MRRYLATTAIAIFATLTFNILTTGCSGCGRGDRSSVSDTLTPEQNRELILSTPENHDRQTLAELAASIASGAPISIEQMATMIVQCEAHANYFESQIDALERNDDAADTYNVLAETRHSQWVDDYATVMRYLRQAQLRDDERARVSQLDSTNARINAQLAQLQQTQLRGHDVFVFKP